MMIVRQSKRLYVLIAIAVVLAGVTMAVWAPVSPWGQKSQDALLAKVGRLQEDRDVQGLAEAASSSETRLAVQATRALGSMGPEAAAHIQRGLKDTREPVREAAACAMGRLGRRLPDRRPDEVGGLARVGREDPSPRVRAAAVTALGAIRAYEQMETLLDAMNDRNATVRRRAAEAAARILGRHYRYDAKDPPEQRRASIEMLRRVWAKAEPVVGRYHQNARRNQ